MSKRKSENQVESEKKTKYTLIGKDRFVTMLFDEIAHKYLSSFTSPTEFFECWRDCGQLVRIYLHSKAKMDFKCFGVNMQAYRKGDVITAVRIGASTEIDDCDYYCTTGHNCWADIMNAADKNESCFTLPRSGVTILEIIDEYEEDDIFTSNEIESSEIVCNWTFNRDGTIDIQDGHQLAVFVERKDVIAKIKQSIELE